LSSPEVEAIWPPLIQLNFDDDRAVYYIQPDLPAQLRWKVIKYREFWFLCPSTASRLYNHVEDLQRWISQKGISKGVHSKDLHTKQDLLLLFVGVKRHVD
jgi:hypothetical protein